MAIFWPKKDRDFYQGWGKWDLVVERKGFDS
jgi:hypothetical protein